MRMGAAELGFDAQHTLCVPCVALSQPWWALRQPSAATLMLCWHCVLVFLRAQVLPAW